jgi:hypothetical protein
MKNKILRINRDTSDLNFVIRFPDDKTIEDIEDVIFLIKNEDDTPLDEALLSKTLLAGEITLYNLDVAKVTTWSVSDYDPFEIGVLYQAALFCKWKDDPDFDENVESLFDFQLVQNFHNNN